MSESVGPVNIQPFEDFYSAEFGSLVRYAMIHGARLDDAQDVAQEAMAQASRVWGTLTNPRAWVRVAANHEIARAIRRRMREEVLSQALLRIRPRDDSDTVEATEGWQEVRRFLSTLPPAQLEVFALTVDGYKPQEIAVMLGKTPQTVRANLREARKRLRSAFPLEPASGHPDTEIEGIGDI